MTRFIILFTLIACSACSAPSENTSQVARGEVVTATASEVMLRPGGEGEATVRLRIADGYHINANPPSEKFYIGTQLTVTAQAGIEPGKPFYPEAVNKKFGFAPQPLAVYENDAVIRLPIVASASAAMGKHDLPAKIRVQPCNDEACLPPRDVQVTIPVTIN